MGTQESRLRLALGYAARQQDSDQEYTANADAKHGIRGPATVRAVQYCAEQAMQ